MSIKRDSKGRFLKGFAPNPGGRPPEVKEVRELARQYTIPAIGALVEICTDKQQPGSARVSAAQALLDRGYGRPPQNTDINLHAQQGGLLGVLSALAVDHETEEGHDRIQ